MAGGYTGALAALIALWHRRRTGRGQFVDLSQFEAVVSVVGPSILDITVNRRAQTPPGYRSQELPAAPHGVYRCRPLDADDDRWIAITVRTQAQWESFLGVIGSPAWAYEPKFRTLYLRMRNHEELDAHVSQWTAEQSAEDAMARLQGASVIAGVVSNGADLCERDPHLRARKFWGEAALADGTFARVTGIPAKLSATPGTIRTASPPIGSANDYVLGELLGYSRAEREALIADKAVWP
jgi:crotonobetainyl-CoA:carnitine CoA-transferase CaiB-like acyl-CoA transferase